MLGLMVLMPLYTDEIASKMQLTRPLATGGRFVTLFPECATSVQPLPLTYYPAAAFYHVVFAPLGIAGLKISAMLLLIPLFGGAWIAVRRLTRDREQRAFRFATLIAPLSIAAMPIAFVSARSEPLLILGLGLFAAFPFAWTIASRSSPVGRAAVTAGFISLTSLFYYSHLKALLFTPVVLVSLALTFGRRRVAWLLVALAFTLLTVRGTYTLGKNFTTCPEAPKLQSLLHSLSLSPGELLTHPVAFVRSGVENLSKHRRDVSDQVRLEPPRQTGRWLPASSKALGPHLARFDEANGLVLGGLYVAMPVYLVLTSLLGLRRPRYRARAALALALALSTLAHAFFANLWAFSTTTPSSSPRTSSPCWSRRPSSSAAAGWSAAQAGLLCRSLPV